MDKKAIFFKQLKGFSTYENPYMQIFLKNDFLQKLLFDQFLKTKMKPYFELYLKNYKKEVIKEEGENKIRAKFNDEIKNKSLSHDYYSHLIENTHIFKQLDKVQIEIKDFYRKCFDQNNYDSNDFVEVVMKNIINKLNEIRVPQLTNIILDDFENNQENIEIVIEDIMGEIINDDNGLKVDSVELKFRELKRNADNYVNDYFKEIKYKRKEPVNDLLSKNGEYDFLKDSLKDDLINILEILSPLKGSWNRSKILNNSDFQRLINYSVSIIKTNKLPIEVKRFPDTGTTIEFIRKTLHLAYRELSKTNKKEWVELLHLFKQLDNTSRTTSMSKFSAYNGDYENDIKNCISQ